jgi:hypothetical protein
MPAARWARKIISNKYAENVLKCGENMLKIFTLRYEERTVFNDSIMTNFLSDK